jgi:hypothetical protein
LIYNLIFTFFQDTPPTEEFLANHGKSIKPQKHQSLTSHFKTATSQFKTATSQIRPVSFTNLSIKKETVPLLRQIKTIGSTSSDKNWLSSLQASVFQNLNLDLIPNQNSSRIIQNLISLSKIANPECENRRKLLINENSRQNLGNGSVLSKVVAADAKKPALDFETNFW